eukprot:jgi/Chlat1/3315/Chrsp22S03480
MAAAVVCVASSVGLVRPWECRSSRLLSIKSCTSRKSVAARRRNSPTGTQRLCVRAAVTEAALAAAQQEAALAAVIAAETLFYAATSPDRKWVYVAGGLALPAALVAVYPQVATESPSTGLLLASGLSAACLLLYIRRFQDTKPDPKEWPGPRAWPSFGALASFLAILGFVSALTH